MQDNYIKKEVDNHLISDNLTGFISLKQQFTKKITTRNVLLMGKIVLITKFYGMQLRTI